MSGRLLASGVVILAGIAGLWWLQGGDQGPEARPVSAPPPDAGAALPSDAAVSQPAVVAVPGPSGGSEPRRSDPAADAAFTDALLAAAAAQEPDPEQPASSAAASQALQPSRVVELLETHYDDPTEEGLRRRLLARDLLVGSGGRAVPVLLEATRDADPTFAVEIQSILGEMGQDAVPPLIDGLGHEDEGVRQAAATALGGLGPEAAAAVEQLIATTTTRNLALGASALQSLIRIGETAIPALVAALDDPDPAIRWVPVYVLGELRSAAQPTLGILEPLLEDENEFVRHQVKIALEKIEQAG